ncbi:hypothetical protein F5882DRAFT_411775 [Hyaloscypha sp. PMI_1271]|nr:hypothetical protein F5882DRAFT_411775 [Hyaloscypha sp. PMI_1271]
MMVVNALLLQWLGLVELLVRERFSAMEFVGETMSGGPDLDRFILASSAEYLGVHFYSARGAENPLIDTPSEII